MHKETGRLGGRGHHDRAALGRQVRQQRPTRSRAACTASASRWSTSSPSGCELEIHRDGGVFEQKYRRGEPGDADRASRQDSSKTGTKVTFKPDAEIFSVLEFHYDMLVQRLRELAFLNPGLRIRFDDERNGKEHEFAYEGGIAAFVEYLNRNKTTLHPKPIDFVDRRTTGEQRRGRAAVERRLQREHLRVHQHDQQPRRRHPPVGASRRRSPAPSTTTRRPPACSRTRTRALSGDDVREGLTAVVSVRIHDPKFSSQTKDKLVSSAGQGLGRVGGQRRAWPSSSRRTRRSPAGSSRSASRRRGRARRRARRAS